MQIKDLINTNKIKKIVILPHARPDADALGSCLALYGILKALNHDVTVVSPTDFPSFLKWMNGSNKILINNNENKNQVNEKISNAEIIFCIDFSSISRINDLAEYVKKAKAVKVIIDHHPEPEPFANLKIWDTNAAATAVLIFELIANLNLKHLINKNIAQCIYAGIMTDTSSFQNRNTTSKSHLITSELINLGANVTEVAKQIYNCNSINRLQYLGYIINKRLSILEKYKTAYITLKKDDWAKFDLKIGDTEGFVNYPLSVKGIRFAAMIAEKDDHIRLSFRSSGDVICNTIAKEYFNGGGHKYAAGGKSYLSLNETILKFENVVKKFL